MLLYVWWGGVFFNKSICVIYQIEGINQIMCYFDVKIDLHICSSLFATSYLVEKK